MKNEKQTRVFAHLAELEKIAGLYISDSTDAGKMSLFRKLRRMECRARRLSEAQCNASTYSTRNDDELERIETRLKGMFRYPENVGVNKDPRGYALKIFGDYRNTSAVIDWGYNVVVAPEL